MKNQDTNKIYYVYFHKRKTNGEIFYIGKGKLNRCFVKYGRSLYWNNIVNKDGYIVEIFKDNLSEQESLKKEIELINIYKPICNFTNGGDGSIGFIINNETKEKFRLAKLGKKQSPSHAAKSRIARLGKKNSIESTEKTISLKRKKIINSNGEIFNSASDAARKISLKMNIKCSQGNISMCANGLRNNAYNLTWSYDLSKIPMFKKTEYKTKKILLIEKNIIFESVQDAKKYIISILGRANNQVISFAARNNCVNKKAYGYTWRYI